MKMTDGADKLKLEAETAQNKRDILELTEFLILNLNAANKRGAFDLSEATNIGNNADKLIKLLKI